MGRLNWRQIVDELRRAESVPDPVEPDRFWPDFEARASLVTRESPEARGLGTAGLWLGWAAAGLACLAVFVGIIMRTPAAPPATAAAFSEVQEIDVLVSYSTMMIMQDSDSGSTLVWVGGMGEDQNEL